MVYGLIHRYPLSGSLTLADYFLNNVIERWYFYLLWQVSPVQRLHLSIHQKSKGSEPSDDSPIPASRGKKKGSEAA